MKREGGGILIQAIASKITKYMVDIGVCSKDYTIHKYGIEVMISTMIDFGFIIGIGFMSQHFIDSIIYYFAFWFIRKFSGGYHCETYFKCITLHVTLFIAYLLTYHYYSYFMIWIYLLSLMVFILLSPIKNRDLDQSVYKKYKIISLSILIVYLTLSYLTTHTNILTYVVLIVSLLMVACIKKYETQII